MRLTQWQSPGLSWRLGQLSNLQDEIDRLFSAPPAGWNRRETTQPFMSGWSPAIDVYEDKDALHVKAELPGMNKEDISISLHEGVLSLSGERREEKRTEETENHRVERFVGRFQRTVTLPTPVNVDQVNASYKDGLLLVTLPKTDEAKPKEIKLN